MKDLAKKLEEIQGQSSPATVAPVSPGNVNPLTMMPQYVCPRPRVAPEIRVEHIQRINANSGRRRSYPARSGQNDSLLQQEVDFLRRQVMEMRAGQIAAGSGQGAAGYGQIVAGQGQFGTGKGQIAAGPGQGTAGYGSGGPGQGQIGAGQGQVTAGQGQIAAGARQDTTVHMVENDPVGMLASALDDLTYEDDPYADFLAWDREQPKLAEKRKQTVSDGETTEPRQRPKRLTLKPVASRKPGVAISEEDLAATPPVVRLATCSRKPRAGGVIPMSASLSA